MRPLASHGHTGSYFGHPGGENRAQPQGKRSGKMRRTLKNRLADRPGLWTLRAVSTPFSTPTSPGPTKAWRRWASNCTCYRCVGNQSKWPAVRALVSLAQHPCSLTGDPGFAAMGFSISCPSRDQGVEGCPLLSCICISCVRIFSGGGRSMNPKIPRLIKQNSSLDPRL